MRGKGPKSLMSQLPLLLFHSAMDSQILVSGAKLQAHQMMTTSTLSIIKCHRLLAKLAMLVSRCSDISTRRNLEALLKEPCRKGANGCKMPKIQDEVAMARSARRIGNQTVLPQFWRKCSPTLQKNELTPEKQTDYGRRTFCSVFPAGSLEVKPDMFLGAIEVGRTRN